MADELKDLARNWCRAAYGPEATNDGEHDAARAIVEQILGDELAALQEELEGDVIQEIYEVIAYRDEKAFESMQGELIEDGILSQDDALLLAADILAGDNDIVKVQSHDREVIHVLRRKDDLEGLVDRLIVGNGFITKTPGVCGGRARIRNTRIPVWAVVQTSWGLPSSLRPAASQAHYPELTDDDVHNAWAYYLAHQAEVNQDIKDNEEA